MKRRRPRLIVALARRRPEVGAAEATGPRRVEDDLAPVVAHVRPGIVERRVQARSELRRAELDAEVDVRIDRAGVGCKPTRTRAREVQRVAVERRARLAAGAVDLTAEILRLVESVTVEARRVDVGSAATAGT